MKKKGNKPDQENYNNFFFHIENNLREKIFHWLEANSDVAANLDIPPKTVYENQFEKCAEISYDNFAWFEKQLYM